MRLGLQFTTALLLAVPVLACPLRLGAVTVSNIGDLAKSVTVRIQGPAGTTGSGFIIEKSGDRYKVLTCRHVVENHPSFSITTADQKRHETRRISMEPFGQDLDLAVVEFVSQSQYPVATIGDSSQVQSGQTAFVGGYPARNSGDNSSFFLFNEGKINARADDSLQNGYGLVYNINTLPGMSGGPVFNDQGHVIGIHGQGDQAEDVTILLEASEVNPGVVVKSGFNYAIPINTFKEHAAAANVKFTPVSASTSVEVTTSSSVVSSASPRPQPPQPKPEVKQIKAVAIKRVFDPKDFFKEAPDNPIKFKQTYSNTILTFQGEVFSVEASGELAPLVNVMSSKQDELSYGLLPSLVMCQVNSPDTLANLNSNDSITIRGTYAGRSSIGSNIVLTECNVVSN